MEKGTVKWFDTQKGYGFITEDSDGKDFFIHQSNIMVNGFRSLHEDDIVEFDIGTSEDGREQAVNVKPILTMSMIEDALREDSLYVTELKASRNTIYLNGLGLDKGYMVIDGNNVIQYGMNGLTFLDLAKYAGFDIKQYVA